MFFLCEFTVYLNGQKVMEDVVFASGNDEEVLIKDIVGISKTFQKAKIVEVNVLNTRLILES